MDEVTGEAVTRLLKKNVASAACLNTDESPVYAVAGKGFAAHDTVDHRDEEYARTDKTRLATINAVEGFFGNNKRSIDGTHHSISRKHTGLCLAEIDHKYNTRKLSDGERTVLGIKQMEGKRLMLRAPKPANATVLSEGYDLLGLNERKPWTW